MTEFYYGELIDPAIENINIISKIDDTEVCLKFSKVYFWIKTYPSRDNFNLSYS